MERDSDQHHVEAKLHGHRQLYDIPSFVTGKAEDNKAAAQDARDLLNMINQSIIGRDITFKSPFGIRRIVYCDYTASGKALTFIENYIRDVVLPHYGNTHTTVSVTALQTTMFRDEARSIIRKSVNAAENDAVLFVGSGSTGAIHKLIHGMQFTKPPVVFVGPYEHHSVLLPWREVGSEMIMITEDSYGNVDLSVLEAKLKAKEGSGERLVGCFSAASNITGILTDTDSITVLLHRYGAVAIWDYSACAPYVDINMNPLILGDTGRLTSKDAIIFSVHKFVGGVGSPGVLIAKKRLFQNPVPDQTGGGTVFFVNTNNHRYLKEIEHREEGGTPAIVEEIRAGLVFHLKETVTFDVITHRYREIMRKINRAFSSLPNLIVLGNVHANRLPIYSFLIRHPETNRFLHHNYTSALLNDLFGIQSRSGCMCAGPYAQTLMGIDLKLAEEFEEVLLEDPRLEMHRWKVEFSQREILRPGFSRINFPYFFSDQEVDFVCQAVKMIAEHGWKLLPLYKINPETAEWRHKSNTIFQDRIWLSAVQFKNGKLEYPNYNKETQDIEINLLSVLDAAQAIFDDAGVKLAMRNFVADQGISFNERAAKLRWFLLPSEASQFLLNARPLPEKCLLPFEPKKYPLTINEIDSLEQPGTLMDGEGSNFEFSSKKVCETNRGSKPDALPMKEHSLAKWFSPTKEIWKPMLTAINEFGMIRNKDRILVCLSGGKDSLTLLHSMRQFKFYAKSLGLSVEIAAVTVDPASTLYDPSPLIPYVKALGIPYFYERQGIMKTAMNLDELNSICSFCSRLKRGRLYSCARRENYNVLAFGQHLDDLTESFFMSVFHNGRLRTMKASYTVEEGDLRMIRPLVYVRERDTRAFAESRHLPVIFENCPACFEAPKERFRVKQLLAGQELLYPGLYDTLKTALKPLMGFSVAGAEKLIPELPGILDEVFRSRIKNTVQTNSADYTEDENC